MPRLFRVRRDRQDGRRRRWLAASAAGVLAGATMLAFSAAPATAAAAPHYTAGRDVATFSALGVTDANCFLGVGGNEIWIKPGDSIDFNSSLVGLDLDHVRLNGLLTNLLGGLLNVLGAHVTDFKIAGLHVSATIDKGKTSAQTFTVDSTGMTNIRGLGEGAHSMDWTVDSITVLPILKKLLGGSITGSLTTISLTKALDLGGTLQAGAKLNWHGTIYVSDNANNCALPAVSVPGVEVTVGNTEVTTPQVNVDPTGGSSTGPISVGTPTGSSPTTGTHSPGTNHDPGPGAVTGSAGTGGAASGTVPNSNGHSTGTSGGFGNAGPDTGGAGGGGFGNAYPDTGGGHVFGAAGPDGGQQNGSAANGATPSQHLASANKHDQQDSAAALAANGPKAASMPVLLAVLAIIALALVTATYARLYLLRRG